LYSIVDKAKKYDELAFIQRERILSCSFCGKNQNEVKKLIAAHHVYICNECVDLCLDILKETDEGESDNND
jgi:hypothetical protein